MIEIRRIGPDDGPVLRELRLAALTDSPWAFGSTFERETAFTDQTWRERAGEASAGSDRALFLAAFPAARDRSVIGLAGGMRSTGRPEVIELVSMWVAPEGRQRGTGRLLVAAVTAWAATTDARRLELWVTVGNERAHRLYLACGFVEQGDHQPLPSDPCRDELRMVRPLGPDPAEPEEHS